MVDLSKKNEMWVVIRTSFSPNYEGGNTYEYRSVVFVTGSEEIAKKFVDDKMKNRDSDWSAEYDYEEVEVR